MSDAQRAELRRRFLAGDPDAGAGLLESLTRSGELRADAVRLGAHLGDPCASLLLPQAKGAEDFEGWVAGLEPFGVEVWIRVGLAALRSLLPLWSDPTEGHGEDDRLAREIDLAQAYVDEPSPERAQSLGRTWSEPEDLAFRGGQAVDVWDVLGELTRVRKFVCLDIALDRASVGGGERRVREAARRELCAWLFPDPAWKS